MLTDAPAYSPDLAESDGAASDSVVSQPHATITTADADNATILVGRTVAEVERRLILDTLDHTLGNRTHAANILGISIRTLRNKLRQYNEEGFDVPPSALSDVDDGEVMRA
jgi:DNA-binding NtrC family response regulator